MTTWGRGVLFHVLPFRNIVYFLRVISFIPYKRRIVFIPCSKYGLFFPLTMLTRDLQFSICSGVLSCVLLCATYFFYHKIEMKVCFFIEEVYSVTIWNFFLTCIEISSNCFAGDFTLLLPVSLKSPSHEPKCKHFYIYNHFVEFMKNFPPHTATSAVPQ